MGKLDGRIALVTGGGRGIGRAIALGLAKEGCGVAVSSRTAEELERVAQEVTSLGGKGFPVTADAMSYDAVKASVETVLGHFGQIDILINNAGGVIPGPTPFSLLSASHDDQAFIDNLLLNLVSAQRASREVLGHMLERGHGRIINIGSGYAKRSGGAAAYSAAKHGLIGLTRATAAEVATRGVTVNCLCPGWTNTQLVDWNVLGMQWGTDAEGARARASAENLQNRVLEPEELAPMAVLLASDEAAGITGQVISVDGGYGV
ncbi:MAG: SDR family oxidoreductase [Pseudomonadales bacterium]|jgi:NAD(P)-dependent dehydrogenase (short-subunit alcohol dehydrogenase family)|nr:SDR family oxidoreductase [Pseudomonadales bacterium]MDP6472223.1 SDR family oxidoreductase [Pseudomonadales bacterium]MDP6826525.1 SDR family oxidoreductase [Pseudomonadales bacterium]MDP6970333.1 SDR family oxidoreductase [Pseudomonadales bacterium]|tara:strand:+ start:1539 stop:2324 length:786 start_codon:yes stop_codon:yes gene_type:complete